MSRTRRARVRAFSKINTDLRVLGKRADGYHELRTIFQTISLADTLELEFTPGRGSEITLEDSAAIADNLVVRAARLVLEELKISGRLEMRLDKRVPMGAGLGGGSSDAAAVLLALPVLAGGVMAPERLMKLAAALGSDVNFFLMGGTAAGVGRGTELFPMPDSRVCHGLLLAPGVHVSTAEAYRALSPRLTSESEQNKIFSFQSLLWFGGQGSAGNDFEEVVFERHGELAALKRKLGRVGARPAMMTGSGSSIFGWFPSRKDAAGARGKFGAQDAHLISTVSRARYRASWWRALEAHINGKLWPPRSRYAR
jgi:4-diphosphocytidyl-2-C-methyl-D-erythritol kinase